MDPAPSRTSPQLAAADHRGSSPDNDIRLLGRILGEVIEEQAGSDVFDLVEHIRQFAVDRRRIVERHEPIVPQSDELDSVLDGLSIVDSLHVIRAFTFFSLLANIAQDVHHSRRRRHHRTIGSAPQRYTVRQVLETV